MKTVVLPISAESSIRLHAHLGQALHDCMHLMVPLTKGVLYGAFHREENKTKAMFAFNSEFVEFEIRVNGDVVSYSRKASSAWNPELDKMLGKRLSNYIERRISSEIAWNESDENPPIKRKSGRVYLQRVFPATAKVHAKNMSLAEEHNLAVLFSERLTGYNLKFWLKN